MRFYCLIWVDTINLRLMHLHHISITKASKEIISLCSRVVSQKKGPLLLVWQNGVAHKNPKRKKCQQISNILKLLLCENWTKIPLIPPSISKIFQKERKLYQKKAGYSPFLTSFRLEIKYSYTHWYQTKRHEVKLWHFKSETHSVLTRIWELYLIKIP